ncbi:MAG: hypothetical protein MJ007_03995 [Paludibacteraceae bacterium]|nr:hypothetical protein [Paludibacteraceae bacterium]
MKRISLILPTLFAVVFMYAAEPDFSALKSKIYTSYMNQDIKSWKLVIDDFHRGSLSNIDSLDFILSVEYGYVAWCISDSNSTNCEKYLNIAFSDLDKFDKKIEVVPIETHLRKTLEAKYKSYYSALLAYQIKISPVRAIINGWKSVNNAKSAITEMPDCWFSQIEYGNVMHYMPTVLGGSNINAVNAYLKAIRLMESNSDKEIVNNNWLYLHAIICLADAYKTIEDYANVRKCYNKILKVEPNYKWVRESLLPSLEHIGK